MNQRFRHTLLRLQALYEEREARALLFLILEEAFGVSKVDVYADKVRDFSSDEECLLENILQRMEKGVPLQYVLGHATFCGMSFRVTPATLIPRPETEQLATLPLPTGPLHLLDVGTGSGCIAISLKRLHPDAKVQAWDISEEALNVARFNAAALDAPVDFQRKNLFEEVLRLKLEQQEEGDSYNGKAEAGSRRQEETEKELFIFSNPPYVRESERQEMQRQVLEHEPESALFVPDTDPLLFYRALCELGKLMRARGVFVEINRAFGHETLQLFREAGYIKTELQQDIFGNDRFVLAYLS